MLLKQRADANTKHFEQEGRRSCSDVATLPARDAVAGQLRLLAGTGLQKLAGLEVWRCSSVKTGQINPAFPQQFHRYGTRLLSPLRERSGSERWPPEHHAGMETAVSSRDSSSAAARPSGTTLGSALLCRARAPRLPREVAGPRPAPGRDAAEVTAARGRAPPHTLFLSSPRGLPTRGDQEPQLPCTWPRCPAPGCASSAPAQTHRHTPRQPPLTLQRLNNHRPPHRH